MIEILNKIVYSLSFGVGATLSILGLLLMYQIFVVGRKFNSQTLMTQVSLLASSLGLSLLFFNVVSLL